MGLTGAARGTRGGVVRGLNAPVVQTASPSCRARAAVVGGSVPGVEQGLCAAPLRACAVRGTWGAGPRTVLGLGTGIAGTHAVTAADRRNGGNRWPGLPGGPSRPPCVTFPRVAGSLRGPAAAPRGRCHNARLQGSEGIGPGRRGPGTPDRLWRSRRWAQTLLPRVRPPPLMRAVPFEQFAPAPKSRIFVLHAECVGSMRSDGGCGWCSLWRRLCVSGAQ